MEVMVQYKTNLIDVIDPMNIEDVGPRLQSPGFGVLMITKHI